MTLFVIRNHARSIVCDAVRLRALSYGSGLILALSLSAPAQQPVVPVPGAVQAAPTASPSNQSSKRDPASAVANGDSIDPSQAGGITEDELKQLLVGKALYLRGGFLENSLEFDEHGALTSKSPQGSFTLSAIQIEKVRLTKHKIALEGARYGLHFVGQLAYEDPASAVDRVRITPKKKKVKISIDREIVVKPKKVKDEENDKGKKRNGKTGAVLQGATVPVELTKMIAATQVKAPIAAEQQRPADAKGVTTTTSPAHATRVLKDALDRIFAQGLDERMMASMPDFWKLYYQAAAARTDYRPKDAAVFSQNIVDRKARLTSTFEPASNEFAQANGVAGMCLYHTVIGADGKPGEIAVGRPIGFGLDESAVESIRKASFEPAIKDGKAVAVFLDLVVQFRIYSKRTAVLAKTEEVQTAPGPILPGPFTVQRQ